MKIKDTFDCVYDLGNRLWKHAGAPDMTKDPQMRRYLMAHSKLDCRSPEFLRLQDNFYKPKGYQPGQSENYLKMNIGRMMARQYKVTTYIDHYLNTITYHYVTYMPSGVTVLARITETGYIFQRREMLEQEIAGSMPPEINNFIETLKNIFDKQKAKSEKELQQAKEKNKRDEQKKLDELMSVSTIKLAYNGLEIANGKLIATAEKMEKLSKSYSHNKLNTFLKNTQNEIEMHRLKIEYNTIARECLAQLTKFRLNVQSWASQHPQYAKVADWILTGAKYGAECVAIAGIVTAVIGTAPISLPTATAGAGIAYGKKELKDYIRQEIVSYATKQGTTFKERQEFEETAHWIIKGFLGISNTKNIVNAAKNYKTFFKQKPIKTYISKIDRNIELAHLLRDASKGYYKTHKQRLMDDVLNIWAHE